MGDYVKILMIVYKPVVRMSRIFYKANKSYVNHICKMFP